MRTSRRTMLILGVLTVLALVCSNLAGYYAPEEKQHIENIQQASNDDDKDQTDHDAQFSLPSFTLQPSVGLHAAHEAVFLFELVLSLDNEPVRQDFKPLPLGKYLKTLFCLIQAPNAP